MTPNQTEELPPHANNIHGELLPEKYRFSPEDELRLAESDFYSHEESGIPPADITEADRFMAWRWYGTFYSPMREELLNAMAWRISRERQLRTERSAHQITSRALDNLCRQIGGSDRWEEVKKIQLAIAKKELMKCKKLLPKKSRSVSTLEGNKK